MHEREKACNLAMWNPFLSLENPVTKVIGLASLETRKPKKNFPNAKGDYSPITSVTIGWFQLLPFRARNNEHRGILHEFQGTKWSKASNEIHGSPTCFPHPGPAETMDRLILGCKMGCKIVVLHPIMVDKRRILAHEWYLICILNGMSYLASWTERLRLCSYKPGGF